MRNLVCLFVSFILISCTTSIKPKEDTAPSDSSRVKITVGEKTKPESKLLLIASFTEPFMYAQFYSDKAVFSFPDKDTLIWQHAFDSLNFTKDFKLNELVNEKTILVNIENKACTHPGSGESWSKKALIEIDKVIYQGCAKLN